jgi:hypothetical protein
LIETRPELKASVSIDHGGPFDGDGSADSRPDHPDHLRHAAYPRPGYGPREQKALPIVEVVHELDEPDQACRSCGGALQPLVGQSVEAEPHYPVAGEMTDLIGQLYAIEAEA